MSRLQSRRHLRNEEVDNCLHPTCMMKYVGHSDKQLFKGRRRMQLKDQIHFYRYLPMTCVSPVSYMSKPFSSIPNSSHDIIMKMLSVICKSIFSSITIGSHDIVIKMLSDICQSISSPLQPVVTTYSETCCQLYVKTSLPHYN